TDDAALAIVARVLGDINRDLARLLKSLGVESSAMIDTDHFPLEGSLLRLDDSDGKPIDLGWVGSVSDVDVEGLLSWRLKECGEVPVIPSLASFAGSPS